MKKFTLISFLMCCSLLSMAQLSWLQIPDFPGTPRRGAVSFSINGLGYTGLGLLGTGQGETDMYAYDPISNTWSQKADFPATGRFGCVTFVIGGKAYVCTGSTGAPSADLWEYDATGNTWTAKASYPGGLRESAAGFSVGGKGYVGTGYAGGNSYTDFYEYDPVMDMWNQRASFPGPARNGSAAFSIGTKGYIGLGNNTNSTSNFRDFYEYDPGTDTWAQKADFPIPYVVEPCTYSSTTSGYVLCGYYYQGVGITHNPLNMFYRYDQQQDAWTLEGTFPGYPRGYASGFLLNDDIYIGVGGQTNTFAPMFNDFWKLSNGALLSVGNVSHDQDFGMYPNPANHSIQVGQEMTGKKLDHIRIYNSIGKMVMTKKLDDAKQSIDVSSLSGGLYFVELITAKGEVMDSRFIKQ